ncbi:hypothetical protein ACQ4PT_004301 [Festuca glaucescens]
MRWRGLQLRQESVVVGVVLLLAAAARLSSEAKLSQSYYASTCPNVEALVRGVVTQKLQETFNAAPGTLRLFFHDCFVWGCDASVLISGPGDEHGAGADTTLSPDALDLITRAKAAVEASCANTVSCADILAIATRDVVSQRFLLLGCEELRAVLWPPKGSRQVLDVLRIDTTSRSESDNAVERKLSDSASTRSSSVVHKGKALHAHPYCRKSLKEQKEKYFNRWRISLTDARLLRSLLPIIEDLRETFETVYSQLRRRGSLHVYICAAAALGGRNVQGAMSSRTNHVHRSTLVDSKYKDIFKEAGLANKYDDWDDGPAPSAVTLMWDCPKIDLGDDYQTCIIEMIVNEQRKEPLGDAYSAGKPLQDAASIELLADAFWAAQYESGEDSWSDLRWCRVERCPKIHTVFRTPKGSKNLHGCRFPNLRTFWASQLLTARYVWSWSTATSHPDAYYSFHDLGFLHLDYCPRLVHVLPVQVHMSYSLRTIEIVYCADLTEIFPLYMHDETQGQSLEMPRLERIHLCKLPKLQHICGLKLTAPMLKTVKIRGCWSLKRLLAISYYTEPPKVDCKKEWWDSLDWDGLEANHHPSLYKPTHSAYYKKRLARGSLLRLDKIRQQREKNCPKLHRHYIDKFKAIIIKIQDPMTVLVHVQPFDGEAFNLWLGYPDATQGNEKQLHGLDKIRQQREKNCPKLHRHYIDKFKAIIIKIQDPMTVLVHVQPFDGEAFNLWLGNVSRLYIKPLAFAAEDIGDGIYQDGEDMANLEYNKHVREGRNPDPTRELHFVASFAMHVPSRINRERMITRLV